MARLEERSIEEDLIELDRSIQRLRIEYDQYFMGAGRREPLQLRAKVQKFITRYSSDPPRNTQLKFKFNSLVARFQALRSLWGRTLREIEAGTYRRHRFRADLHERSRREPAPDDERPTSRRRGSAMDQLFDALSSARAKTGEAAIDRAELETLVREQTSRIRAQRPGGRLRFRVVVEGNRAKLKVGVG